MIIDYNDMEGSFIGEKFARASSDHFEFSRWHCPERRPEVRPHGHHDAHIICVLSGELDSDAEGEVPRNHLAIQFNPRETYHADRFVSPTGSFLSISLSAMISRYCEAIDLPSVPSFFSSVESQALLFRLMRELASGYPDTTGLVDAYGLELLGFLSGDAPSETRAPRWLKHAAEYLRCAEHDPSTVETAEQVGVHPVHFARTFKQIFHCTPGEYRRAIKLNRAMRLLSTTEDPLAWIAVEAGFADQSHMSKIFKSTYGMPPGAFCRMLRSRC